MRYDLGAVAFWLRPVPVADIGPERPDGELNPSRYDDAFLAPQLNFCNRTQHEPIRRFCGRLRQYPALEPL